MPMNLEAMGFDKAHAALVNAGYMVTTKTSHPAGSPRYTVILRKGKKTWEATEPVHFAALLAAYQAASGQEESPSTTSKASDASAETSTSTSAESSS